MTQSTPSDQTIPRGIKQDSAMYTPPPLPRLYPMAELHTSSFNEVLDALIGKTPQILQLTSFNLSN